MKTLTGIELYRFAKIIVKNYKEDFVPMVSDSDLWVAYSAVTQIDDLFCPAYIVAEAKIQREQEKK